MGTTPVWQTASPGKQGVAGAVNQFLGTHTSSLIYAGTLKDNQVTATPFYSDTQTQYLAQSFTTAVGQTGVGQVLLRLATVGGSPTTELIAPLTVSLYASTGAVPTGSALASTTVPSTYVYSSGTWTTIPFPVSGLTASTIYHLVITMVGTAGHYYTWQRSNQVNGADTSIDGISWTNQSYGFTFQIFDQSAAGGGPVQMTYDDGGARWTQLSYNANGTINQITEFTESPVGGVNLLSVKTLSYASGAMSGVS